MQQVRLTLALSEVNEILEALGLRPYASVYRLIDNIQEQAASQLAADDAAPFAGETHERPKGDGT